MKTLNIIIQTLTTATVLCCSCNTKHLTTQRSLQIEQHGENVSLHSRQYERLNSSRMISISDSANHLYRINIFPLDTFSFSMQDGFTGKASRIEVLSSLQKFRNFSDSTRFGIEKQREVDYNSEVKLNLKSSGSTKVLEKKKSIGMGVLLFIVLLGLIGGVFWGLRKR